MSSRQVRPLRRALLPLLALIGITVSNCGPDSSEPTSPATAGPVIAPSPGGELSLAVAAQARHTDELLKIRGVVGTAVGLDESGHARVKLLTESKGVPGLPANIDGVPVSVVVTGKIRALPAMASARSPAAASAALIDATKKFARPVPIGVSTGSQVGLCLAGTISARVKANGKTYALSNNHVYANENQAPIGSKVLQPGRLDLGCSLGNSAVLGTLSKFVRIRFDSTANNRVDAAIAAVSTANLSRHTPSDGYGTPQSNPVAASLNQQVEKYGRTTGLTTGRVTGLNVIVLIDYGAGRVARFVGQILIQKSKGGGPFADEGDSGSLIVNLNRRPVGLLFAGARDGTILANPIGAVLNALGVTIDGT